VVRFVPSLPGYVYATRGTTIYVNLYAAGTASVTLPGGKVRLQQKTRYPWDGRVEISVEPDEAGEFAMSLRIPEWCQGAKLAINGQPAPLAIQKGYARSSRAWKAGDRLVLDLPMEVRRIEAHPRVEADRGRVAIQRGPIVYCLEGVDNPAGVRNVMLGKEPQFSSEHRAELLGGVTVIHAVARDGRKLTAVPYYAWDHRAAGPMIVWVNQDGKSRTPGVDDPSWAGKLYRPLDPTTLGAATKLIE
jgi:DUF1680 family protein